MAGSGSLAGPVSAAQFHFNAWPWLEAASSVSHLLGGDSVLNAVAGTNAISKGSDGRLVILLVGSDYRARLAGTGERMDSIMVMTINNNHQMAAVSIPRDVGNVPIGPGEIFKPKINGLFKHYKQIYGTREAALEHMRQAISYALDTPIDYVAYIRFTGFDRLVQNVQGVPVSIAKDIYDQGIYDERATAQGKQNGAKFLATSFAYEYGPSTANLCYTVGNPVNWSASPTCNYALLYVRSRHGPGNNDWVRARRQQNFVLASIKRVIARGSGSNLSSVRSSALSNSNDFYTTLPTDSSSVLSMYNMLVGVSMPNQAVFAPSTYAFTVPGTSKQELKIDVVRNLMHSWFGPL
jgi:anionic cell wall polymer biosynthesis LytR-Cps2A-Psr (LCP) family protein